MATVSSNSPHVNEIVAECKRAIAFQCFSLNQQLLSATGPQQEKTLFEMYHGVHDKIPYVDRFVKGQDQFECMFNKSSNGSQFEQQLLPVLHRRNLHIGVSKNNCTKITADLLSVKSAHSDELMKGNAIRRQAQIVNTNAKKALKYAQEYLVNGAMPSGKTFPDDYAEHLLDKFWTVELKNSEPRPEAWFFPGFFAFMAWGLLPLDGNNKYQCRLMIYSGASNNAADKQGRKALRKEALAEKLSEKKFKAEQAAIKSIPQEKVLQLIIAKEYKKEENLQNKMKYAFAEYTMAKDLLPHTNDLKEVLSKKEKYEGFVKQWEEFVDGKNKGLEYVDDVLMKQQRKYIDLTADVADDVGVDGTKVETKPASWTPERTVSV